MTDAPSFSSGSAFCTVNSMPLALLPNVCVEVLLGDLLQGGELAAAGVGEEHVDAPVVAGHGRVEPVQVGQVGDVALHAGRAVADLGHGGVERVLAAAGDEDVRALGREPLRGGQADAAGAAGHDGRLAVKLPHGWVLPLVLSFFIEH